MAAKVGLFVVLGLSLAAVLLWSFSRGLSFYQPTYELRLKAASVNGLKAHSSVLMAGVPIGSVAGADIAPDGR